MGVTCQILINKPREGVHKAGKPVTGVVKYAIDEPTEYQEVALSFLGIGKCSWTESSGQTSTEYSGSELYISRPVNLKNTRPHETVTLHGVYEYPFEFFLPEDIPTSFKSDIGSITYTIQLKFVKANFFSFNRVFTAEVPVQGTVATRATVDEWGRGVENDGPVIFGLEKTLFTLFAKTPVVNLKAEIAKTCLTPGENVHLSYTLSNNSDLVIPSVQTDLYCYITYTADCGRTNKAQVKVKECKGETPAVAEGEIRKLTCVLPTLPGMYSVQRSRVVSREYRVRVTVRLPVPHANAFVEMPIVLGERTASVEPCLEARDDAGPQPPSYWEAMSEEMTDHKKKEKQ